MKLSVTIPIYNEAENIVPLVTGITAELEKLGAAKGHDWEIILVNDGSRDGSSEKLDAAAAANPRVKAVHFRRNYGQTAAMMAGIHHATGDIIIPMDGDLQNDPADIPALLAKINEGFDVVSGWRRERQDAALRRNLPSRIANWLISRVSGVALHDYGCTLKAYRREVIEKLQLFGEMHRFIPIYAAWEGARVTEIPVRHYPRRFGQSKYGLSRIPRVILDLILIRFLDRAFDRPIQYFGKLGLYSFLGAFLAGLWALERKFIVGESFIQTPLPTLVALLAISGLIFILMGLIAEMQTRTFFEASARKQYLVRSTRNIDSGAASASSPKEQA
ncbi:MAG: glycosyltransferase family 2 protein [Alphaproteobacteria bacterium]|nr:glycosyltransferase family 2 protein [Alphaproteobacteria bacterium]